MSLVTLITDFGNADYYVALLKASIYNRVPEAIVVDISHSIKPHDIMEGAFFLRSVCHRFPNQSIHVVLVNNFYDAKAELLIFEREGFFYIGPNNGIFSLVFEDFGSQNVITFSAEENCDMYDRVAQAIDAIVSGMLVDSLGTRPEHLDQKINLQPVVTSHQIRATIVHIDHFGNVLVNVTKDMFDKIRSGRDYAIYYKGSDPITHLSTTYSDVPLGDVCAFFNSIGLLEIAINMGNAHQLLSLNKNETIQINFY